MKIQELLRQSHISFEVIEHAKGTTLAQLAEEGALPSAELADVTLLNANHGFRYMLAVSALAQPLDLHAAIRALEGCQLQPASPAEQALFCPECEQGRLLPFGSHYDVRMLLDQQLAGENSIAFQEIDGTATIRFRMEDYCSLEHPLVVPLRKGE